MKIALHQDSQISLDLESIAENMNRLAPAINIRVGKKPINFSGFFIINPLSYTEIKTAAKAKTLEVNYSVFFTEKQYDNNFFFDADGNEIIVSLFGWDTLTKIPKNNGALFFIVALIIRNLKIGKSHQKNSGCINDFWGDKTGVDVGMRSAFVCPSCRKTARSGEPFLRQLQIILNDLSAASREETDICSYWSKMQEGNADFDVFICHNTEDKAEIRAICKQLAIHKIKYWLDEEQLPPGRVWQDVLEEQIPKIGSAAIFVGKEGLGPWQHLETRSFLQEFARRKCPMIPVILSTCSTIPNLPIFLRQMTWVDYRKSKPNPLSYLLWGITGTRPSEVTPPLLAAAKKEK